MSAFKKIILAAAATLLVYGCCIQGSGDVEIETRDVSDFEKISLDGSGTVVITRGERFRVTVETDDNLQERIKTKVRGDTLHIDQSSGCIDPTRLRIDIRMPELVGIEIDGSGDVLIEDEFEGSRMSIGIDGSGDVHAEALLTFDEMRVVVDGSGDVTAALDVGLLDTVVDGSADLEYSGYAADHVIEIDGSGDVRAYDLETAVTDITISGSGSCRVVATDRLNVSISGSGDVYYHGNPDVSQRISGSGKVKSTD